MAFIDGERLRFDALSTAIYETSRAWHIKEMFREITFGGRVSIPEHTVLVVENAG